MILIYQGNRANDLNVYTENKHDKTFLVSINLESEKSKMKGLYKLITRNKKNKMKMHFLQITINVFFVQILT